MRSTATADGDDLPLTRAEIDLRVLGANVEALQAHAAPAAVMSVVKANAYGHGALPVARAALAHGASWLGVYTVEEGLRLREGGIEAPILVFGPFTGSQARAAAARRLTLTVTDLPAAERACAAAASTTLECHLKVDTGLHRAGVAPEEALALARRLADARGLALKGIFTHFACADADDPRCAREQLDRFDAVCAELSAEGINVPLRHAANSAATLALPESHLDLVRCGIATYGYYPSAARPVVLQPALGLYSTVTRVHTVHPSEAVGYGHAFRPRVATRIALAPIGYGDGLPRSFGCGRGAVSVRGRRVPVVGRVSMDQITIDVSEVDVRVGDCVTIIDPLPDSGVTADDVAGVLGTISYEVVTGISARVPRLYTRSSTR